MRKRKKEDEYQAHVMERLEKTFPGAIVTKLQPYIQGIPDVAIFYEDKWGVLECKREQKAKHRPNQDYYVDKMNKMSFASFVYPENEEEVFDAIQSAFRIER